MATSRLVLDLDDRRRGSRSLDRDACLIGVAVTEDLSGSCGKSHAREERSISYVPQNKDAGQRRGTDLRYSPTTTNVRNMIDHLLGRPNPSWKRLQVCLRSRIIRCALTPRAVRDQVFFVVFFWLWRILHGNPDGPRILWIRRANRLLSSYTDPKLQMSSHQLFL